MIQYVFSDIHGCYTEFMDVLNKTNLKDDDQLIFLGDYIDRGRDSYKVVEKVIELKHRNNTVTLLGNHEDMLLHNTRLWLMNGGWNTHKSYERELNSEFYLPKTHRDFYESLDLYYETDKFIFVHAGFNSNCIEPNYMLWTREEFYLHEPYSYGKTVVFGHTPFDKPLQKSLRIGIDTGCFATGVLTCLKIDNNKTGFIINKE